VSRTPLPLQTVTTVLIIIAIVVSAGSLSYVMGISGKIEKLTDSVAELESTIGELTSTEKEVVSAIGELGDALGAYGESMAALEERMAEVEEAATLPEAPDYILLGGSLPMTGPAAEAGIALKQGIEIALDEINEKGGVYIKMYGKKVPIKYLFEDCQSKPDVGVSVIEKLITKDKVHMIVGGDAFHSSVTMAIMELAPKYNIPIYSIEPVSYEISKKILNDPVRYKYFFKTSWPAIAYAKGAFDLFKMLMDTGKYDPANKKIAYVVEDTDYGRSNADINQEYMEEIGWEIVTYEVVPLGHTDFYPQLSKIKASEPSWVFTCFTALSSGVAFMKQFREVEIKAHPYAIYYPIHPEFIEQAGEAAEYLVWHPLTWDPEKMPRVRILHEKVVAKYGVSSRSDHGSGYDAIYIAADVVERAGSLEPDDLQAALETLNLRGVTGTTTWDPDLPHTGLYHADPEVGSPCPAAQIVNGESFIVMPEAMAQLYAPSEYVLPPWLEEP